MSLIAGYVGGWLNSFVMRFTDAMIALPPLFLNGCFLQWWPEIWWASALSSVFPLFKLKYSYSKWPGNNPAWEKWLCDSFQLMGQKQLVITCHCCCMFPASLPELHNVWSLPFTMNIKTQSCWESTWVTWVARHYSSYQPGEFMVSEGYKYLFNQPLVANSSGILCAIVLVVIACCVVGDALRDALDPRLRGNCNGRKSIVRCEKSCASFFYRQERVKSVNDV